MSMSPGLPPAAELLIDTPLVRGLLERQHPRLADLELTKASEGWDNVTFRLGSRMAVRLPRRAEAAGLVRHEQRWLPELAPHLPITIPSPIEIGVPHST